jgi:hypothetical protein
MPIKIKQMRDLIAIYAVFALFAKFVIAPYASAESEPASVAISELSAARH